MKLKLCLIGLALLVIYMILPIGEYGVNDVKVNMLDNRNSQFNAMKLSTNEFIERVGNNTKPEVGYIVHPATSISRDGDNTIKGILYLTSGWVRTGEYGTGNIHGALDSDVGGHKNLGTCPAGASDCDDIALIAPVSGTIEKVINNVGNEDNYYKDMKHNSMVVIKASGVFEGRSVWVWHLVNIPDYIVPGYAIKQGEYIGTQCAQGQSTGSHVHLEVRSGQAKVNITEWFTSLTAHSSIGKIQDLTGANPSKQLQGWLSQDVQTFSSNPRYESEVTIPDKYKVK